MNNSIARDVTPACHLQAPQKIPTGRPKSAPLSQDNTNYTMLFRTKMLFDFHANLQMAGSDSPIPSTATTQRSIVHTRRANRTVPCRYPHLHLLHHFPNAPQTPNPPPRCSSTTTITKPDCSGAWAPSRLRLSQPRSPPA
jgi:hypothetical protein